MKALNAVRLLFYCLVVASTVMSIVALLPDEALASACDSCGRPTTCAFHPGDPQYARLTNSECCCKFLAGGECAFECQ